MKNAVRICIVLVLLSSIASAQTAFLGVMPGKSSKADAARAFGAPVATISPTLFEYQARNTGQKLYIQYIEQSDVIDRVEVIFAEPAARQRLAVTLGLGQKADATKWDSKGKLEEYFGEPRLIVLVHESSELASPIIRVGYYSAELFAAALQKPVGRPNLTNRPPPSVPTGGTKPEAKSFKNINLLVPKGDKSENKSVRLLFDGSGMIIDADRGEKIYKQFPYESIVSAEYSYSTKPRWKTAVAATVLIGVFALPIFFMKSKQHWLTIKTANDFAILRLDKDNYKIVLATFDTTTGKRVETVADAK